MYLPYGGYGERLYKRGVVVFKHIDEKYACDCELGAIYSKEQTEFRVWAPEAEQVRVHLYKSCRDEKP